ncbi:LacI family DNA-binding transcriptional regulator [Paracoccus sp. (in: a-proteobacteria)]|uniref:LacI family DNA-binding transcriptional regulator n=1 Tax=Paracoccus sp. TaxID=267 RepID=UPI002AFE0816|nr:LacI family DNA-binding transcriptional regulator [Paracoccus sp. (in: a-proteobacteria)]
MRMMTHTGRARGWKGPSLKEIAQLSGLGTATVDRVLNNRAGVREKTRLRVLAALEKLSHDTAPGERMFDLRLFCESGATFNATMEQAAEAVNRSLPGVRIRGTYIPTSQVDPSTFARQMEQEGGEADGVLVVAREHPATNSAIRKLCAAGVPVVCLTSDLPSSRRSAYIGNDQYAAGSVAALLIGSRLPRERNKILIVMSVPFRSQQEREMGFRRVLRADFPHLRIEERIVANDDADSTGEQLTRHFETHGVPRAIYNVAGANRGVAWALEAVASERDTIFVGHELTQHSRNLLESGIMDFVISHDFVSELIQAAQWIRSTKEGATAHPSTSQILVHTKYNCGL